MYPQSVNPPSSSVPERCTRWYQVIVARVRTVFLATREVPVICTGYVKRRDMRPGLPVSSGLLLMGEWMHVSGWWWLAALLGITVLFFWRLLYQSLVVKAFTYSPAKAAFTPEPPTAGSTPADFTENYEFMTAFARTTPDVLYVYDVPLCKHVFVNREVNRILGYTSEEMQGLPNDALIAQFHPDDVAEVLSGYERWLQEASNRVHHSDFRVRHKNGTIVWLCARTVVITRDANGVPLQLMGVAQDVTERKNAEHQLRESERLHRLLSENSRDLICLHHPDSSLVYVSHAVHDMLGFSPDELTGRLPATLIHPDDVPNFNAMLMGASSGKRTSATEQFRVQRYDGSYLWMETRIKAIRGETGNIVNYQSTSRDISQWKRAEEELIHAKEEALQSAQAKDVFLSTMSHEIRTPMNAVIGMTHLLLQENPKPEQIENLQTLRFAAENLLALINDVLDYNKIEAGRITFEKVDFSLRELIRDIKHSLRPRVEERNIHLRVGIDPELPDRVVGDPVRLSQILNNLIGNAIKFTESGSVVVDVMRNAERSRPSTVCVDFEITDTGIGIPADKLDAIFEQFTQASSDTTRKFGGTGLGLTITKRLLELQNSQVYVESTPGEGSTFRFSLVFDVSDELTAAPSSFPENAVPLPALPDVRILLVEDNAVNQLVATRFLKKWGIVSDCATSGREALEKVAQQTYDLVLMDLQMPEMDGYHVARSIREMSGDYYQQLPIMALTASAMHEVYEKVLRYGMNDYVAKPFDPVDLYQKIVQYTGRTVSLVSQSVTGTNEYALDSSGVDKLVNDQYILELTAGNRPFMEELVHMCIASFEQFKVDYCESLLTKDARRLQFTIHKIRSSIKMLRVFELDKEIEAGEKMIAEHPFSDEQLVQSAEKVKRQCDLIIEELHAKI